jgi:hypothetical protein
MVCRCLLGLAQSLTVPLPVLAVLAVVVVILIVVAVYLLMRRWLAQRAARNTLVQRAPRERGGRAPGVYRLNSVREPGWTFR